MEDKERQREYSQTYRRKQREIVNATDHLGQDKQREAIELHNNGHSIAEISRKIGAYQQTVWRWLNPEKAKESSRKHRAKYIEKRRASDRERWHKAKLNPLTRCKTLLRASMRTARNGGYIGCTASAEEVLAAYTGVCHICRREDGVQKQRLHMDHCHRTGRFRGWLCLTCNMAVGIIEANGYDVEATASRLITYLKT